MLMNDLGKFEPVEFRHADIHQHYGNVSAQQFLQRLLSRTGLDEVFIEALEDRLIAEQLSGLVIHHQNVDAFSVCHFPLRTIVGRF